jgi:cell division cycle protein 37
MIITDRLSLAGEGATVNFNIPDGAPPADLRLEGPGTEGMDIEQVRKALQLRWDLFSSLKPKMQDALKKESLDAINKVLADMDVAEAEDVVEKLQMGGILNFSEQGVRDATGRDEIDAE